MDKQGIEIENSQYSVEEVGHLFMCYFVTINIVIAIIFKKDVLSLAKAETKYIGEGNIFY